MSYPPLILCLLVDDGDRPFLWVLHGRALEEPDRADYCVVTEVLDIHSLKPELIRGDLTPLNESEALVVLQERFVPLYDALLFRGEVGDPIILKEEFLKLVQIVCIPEFNSLVDDLWVELYHDGIMHSAD